MSKHDPAEFSARQWPDWSFWEDRRRGRVTLVVVNGFALLFLTARITEIVDSTNSVIALGLIGCYILGCVLALWYGPVAPRQRRIAMVIAVFVFGSAPALILGSPDYLTDLTYAIVIGLILLPLRYSLLLGLVTAVSQIGWMQLGYGQVNWGEVATLVGVTVALGVVFALTFTIGHLRAAREQIRAMAVDQERQRVARDLHDILGHSLSTMTIKLTLTRRILESAGDIEPAIAEIDDLETLSRQALSDVRATVSDYRTVTLTAELAGARLALRAAGVRAELPTTADEVPPELRAVFGYVVREAVTNVLRHSDATRCTIRLGRDWVEITDDGSGTTGTTPGHGLIGLAERLATVSGTLEHGKSPGGGFRVLARAQAQVLSTEAGPT